VGSAPAGFTAAVDCVVNLYDRLFTNQTMPAFSRPSAAANEASIALILMEMASF
jgi:hypothetical protein